MQDATLEEESPANAKHNMICGVKASNTDSLAVYDLELFSDSKFSSITHFELPTMFRT
jgi:hypothetical protein